MSNAQPVDSSWRGVLLSSSVLSVALLGDALIYVVLPVNAAAFGIGLTWVGVLLSANRLVRIFAYGLIARLAVSIGLRELGVVAALGAAISTALYGLVEGPWPLLGARLLWGLAYASLVLVTLGYAVVDRSRAGTRVGASRAVQRVGPVLALLGGAWLAGAVGATEVFVLLGALTLGALPLALMTPSLPPEPTSAADAEHRALRGPSPVDGLFFLLGFGVDGLFTFSITLLLAENLSVAGAMLSAGAILALRHLGEGAASPAFGAAADRWGARRVLVGTVGLLAVGFFAIALEQTVAGALVVVAARGGLAALGPAAVVAASPGRSVLAPLARLQAWRDVGAALGPLTAGILLTWSAPEPLHGIAAAVFAAAALGLGRARRAGSG